MSDNPVYPLKPAPELGPGMRVDATGRAFYSSAWLSEPYEVHPWNQPHPDTFCCDPTDNPKEW